MIRWMLLLKRKGAGAVLMTVLAAALPAGAWCAEIPMVGLDDDGNVVELKMNGKDYTEQLGAVVTAMHDSASEALMARSTRKGWSLRTFVLGVGVGFEVGLGPIIKMKATPKFRLAFTNQKEPALP
jgi:hypothetical protein